MLDILPPPIGAEPKTKALMYSIRAFVFLRRQKVLSRGRALVIVPQRKSLLDGFLFSLNMLEIYSETWNKRPLKGGVYP